MLKCLVVSFALCWSMNSWGQMALGSVSLDPYIGYPNLYNLTIYSNYNGNLPNPTDYKNIGGSFSYGARLEYMVSDNVGIGADINYIVSGFTLNFESYTFDANGNYIQDANGYVMTTYSHEEKIQTFRSMFRINYHFVQSNKIDLYAGFGAGVKKVKQIYETNPKNLMYPDEINNKALIPITSRLALGMKVFFTQNIGAHVELGAFGGGLLQAGLSVKF